MILVTTSFDKLLHGSVVWVGGVDFRTWQYWWLGGGVDFPKSFEKFAGLARREKFPEICSDRHGMGTSDPLKMVSDPLKTT